MLDRLQNIHGRFLPETRKSGDLSRFASALELGDRMHLERIPQHLDFFCTEALKFEEAQNIRRKFLGKVVIIIELSLADEGRNFF